MPELTPTSDIAATVLNDLSASDAVDTSSGSVDSVDTSADASVTAISDTTTENGVTPAAHAAAQTQEPAKPADDDDFDAVPERDARGREHRLPHSRVRRMVEKAREKAAKDAEAKYGDYAALQQQVQHMQAAERLMAEQPEVFLTAMAQMNPAYRRYLGQPAADATPKVDDQRPGPDLDLGNGQRTYSQAGLERLMAYERQQAVKEAQRHIMRDLAPLREQHAAQQHIAAASERVRTVLEDARQWPGFKEHEAEIVTVLKANRKLSLDAAYRQVVLPKLTTDRNKLREELLKEIKGAPASTTAPTATAGSSAEPRARTTAEIARSILHGSK